MGFWDGEDQKKGRKVNRFLKVREGMPATVYILDESPTLRYTHFMKDGNGRTVGVKCKGSRHCPICQRNQQLPDRDHRDYVTPSRRYRVNVLDVTPVKECPECGAIYRESNAPPVCSVDACKANLSDVGAEPLKEVKIFEKGPMWMKQIGALENEKHPYTDKVMGIQEFPIRLSAQGTGFDTTPIIIPQMPDDGISPEDYKSERLDLKYGLDLTNEEIRLLMDGGTISDILSARSAEEEVEEEDDEPEEIPF